MNRKTRFQKLDRRITLQGYAEVKNDYGEKEISFSDIATVWANVQYPNRGLSEAFHAQRETAVTTVLFTIRYNDSYKDKKNRILYNSQVYDIISIVEKGERRQYLLIEAQLKE